MKSHRNFGNSTEICAFRLRRKGNMFIDFGGGALVFLPRSVFFAFGKTGSRWKKPTESRNFVFRPPYCTQVGVGFSCVSHFLHAVNLKTNGNPEFFFFFFRLFCSTLLHASWIENRFINFSCRTIVRMVRWSDDHVIAFPSQEKRNWRTAFPGSRKRFYASS